jgi:hypothetical protein
LASFLPIESEPILASNIQYFLRAVSSLGKKNRAQRRHPLRAKKTNGRKKEPNGPEKLGRSALELLHRPEGCCLLPCWPVAFSVQKAEVEGEKL